MVGFGGEGAFRGSVTAARHRTKSATKPRAAQPLNEHDIAESALRLIARNGIDKLSMRTLAGELGVTPMAIYYYVPNKEALLDLLGDAVLSRVPTPAPIGDAWQAQLRALAMAGATILSAYPGLSSVLLARPPGKGARELTRYLISILLAAGFDARQAALAIATYNTYFFGALSWQARLGARRSRARAPRSTGAQLDAVATVGRHLQQLSLTEWMEYGVETLIAGLRVQLEQSRTRNLGASAARSTAPRTARARTAARD